MSAAAKYRRLQILSKEEIKFTPDYEAGELIFWGVFKELANDNKG